MILWRFDDKINGSSGAVPVFWMGQFLILCANGAWRSPRMNPAIMKIVPYILASASRNPLFIILEKYANKINQIVNL